MMRRGFMRSILGMTATLVALSFVQSASANQFDYDFSAGGGEVTGVVTFDDGLAIPNKLVTLGDGIIGYTFTSSFNSIIPDSTVWDPSDTSAPSLQIQFGPGGIAPNDILSAALDATDDAVPAGGFSDVLTLSGGPNGAITGTVFDGLIQSTLTFSDGTFVGVTSAIPEPSTFALGILGLLSLGMFGTRRRHR